MTWIDVWINGAGLGTFLVALAMYSGVESAMAKDVRMILASIVVVCAVTVLTALGDLAGWWSVDRGFFSLGRSVAFIAISLLVIGHRVMVWTRNGSRA